jgi:phosphoenolpyruvate-protein phosphotransferase
MPARTLRGIPASPGVAIGRVHLQLDDLPADAGEVAEVDRGAELDRALCALEAAAAEVEALAARVRGDGRADDADILATGALMARDPTLMADVSSRVAQSGATAGVAIREATEHLAATLSSLDDQDLAARADDIRSIGRRAIRKAADLPPALHTDGPQGAASGRVVVADEMGPADVAELDRRVAAVALAGGGVTAHAAIVARSLGLPMVIGVGVELLELSEGDRVVVDADSGSILIEPTIDEIERARAASEDRARSEQSALEERDLPTVTADGHPVILRANASSGPEVEEAVRLGAAGVGLFRTELAFLGALAWPTREEHLGLLRRALAPLGDGVATVRLLDFGGDKTPPFLAGVAGRGIELMLQAEDALRAQLSALAEISAGVDLKVLVPMVTEAGQLRTVRAMLEECLDDARPGAGRRPVEVGPMVEVPAAATMAEELAEASDFLCIGTNDLSQLQLGVDRGRPGLAPAYHPAVLRLVDLTIRAGHGAGIPVGVCGESASDRLAAPLLLGLGVDLLSVGVSRIGYTRRMLRKLEFPKVEELAQAALKAPSAAQVEEMSRPLGSSLQGV